MTESERSTNNPFTSRSSTNGTKTDSQAASAARDGVKAASDAASDSAGTLTTLPAVLAEKTGAAAQAVRGAVGRGGRLWTAVRARKAVAAGGATAGALVVTAAYTVGRRAGLRQRGPISKLTGGRI
ncbi:hypothetical protein ABZZ20_31450 [Streptomyces sp. NPDC006430]|uniref:hypothetical protein n=1 Tax=Streptomyces sp. NPDC006430 TaxID=3154299 RepID=UPI0033A9089A